MLKDQGFIVAFTEVGNSISMVLIPCFSVLFRCSVSKNKQYNKLILGDFFLDTVTVFENKLC